MRKLTSILLLCALCTALLGYHLLFHLQLAIAKSEMRAFLRNDVDHKDVIEFSFTGKAFQQLEWEDENEFRYNKEMYDVVERKLKGQEIILRCITDKKETALVNEFQKNTRQNASHSIVVQLITAQFLLPNDWSLKGPESFIKKIFADDSPALHKLASAVLPQPPDAC